MKQLCEEAFEHYDRWENTEMKTNSKYVQTKLEMKSIGAQTDISHWVFSLIPKDSSTQINDIGELIFKPEENTETESEYSDHCMSCNKSDMTIYDQAVVTAWKKENNNIKQISQFSLCSCHHWSFYWLDVLVILSKPN